MSKPYAPGDTVTLVFTTSSPTTGAATNADSTPTGIVNKNGTDDGAVTVTVTNLDTGRYKAVFTMPGNYADGDEVNLSISATVGGVTGKNAWHTRLYSGSFPPVPEDTLKIATLTTYSTGTSTTILVNTSAYMANALVGCLIRVEIFDEARTIIANDSAASGTITVERAFVNGAVPLNKAVTIWTTNQASVDANTRVSANIKAVNDITVNGAGTVGNPWGP